MIEYFRVPRIAGSLQNAFLVPMVNLPVIAAGVPDHKNGLPKLVEQFGQIMMASKAQEAVYVLDIQVYVNVLMITK